mgnify:CR=1 FL=1
METKPEICRILRESVGRIKDIQAFAPEEIEYIGIYESGDLLSILQEIKENIEKTMKYLKCPT